ncbi:hypothetical protein GTA62_15265 [Roseobacter sp. HKCCD9010]|uniref:phage protease n=1 Tax=unclassified Roseobacter TaxID=196798 RepID=UPI0014932235|nr:MULTISPECIES: phage protease [unclassified Roseobacter]MBF9050534.1 hypothetical protein [Rhodobacterales bacterium HKCCD4356]NNV12049.1 hypothetical protein [Roseobacter sp. HKCCD7357]NNV17063.1 hypothetical protein [Roseobacter sp. HKCCD8768]NNV26292.1 hypothetical protein [Roseobacter sp. HKCCD8192]NNV30787.1 hypothetical protein [Roseobacter sp. HKCCD9061]
MAFEVATCEARELPQGKAAPTVIHLLPLGTFRGRDGRSWKLDNPHHLIAQFRSRKIDLVVDYEHQADDPGRKKTGPVPAAGWITELEARPDGIWGHVKWTDTAAKLIKEREYRFISPTFKYAPVTGKVVFLKGASLVHEPNLHLTALAREEPTMSTDTDLSDIASALGLPSSADRGAILNAITSQSTPDPAKYVPIEAVRDLMNDRGSKVAMARENEVEAMVSDALDEGFITPGMRDWATALCRQDPDSFVQFTKSAAPAYAHLFKPAVSGSPLSEPKSRAYDEAELAICAQLDIEPGTMVER